MRKIALCDMTLTVKRNELSFKEKLEIARQLDHLQVDVIEFPAMENARADTLLVRTASAFVKKSVLCVDAGRTEESVAAAAEALSAAKKTRLKVSLPVSAVCMEYDCHCKPAKLLELLETLVRAAKDACEDVEFCALDATRAEPDFLTAALDTAKTAGAARVTLCDTAGESMPDDFAAFVRAVKETTDLPLGVAVCDKNGLAAANAILAVKAGATEVKTTNGSDAFAPFETVAALLKNCGGTQGLSSGIRMTELGRSLSQITWIMGKETNGQETVPAVSNEEKLDVSAEPLTVSRMVKDLGYDLSDEDNANVYAEFKRVAAKKNVTAKELDAIVASVALQVPPTYRLQSYVINNGNIITASAQITLTKNGEPLAGIGIGDGPVDAAFRTVDSLVGCHYELDDFSIQSVTEGREAVGSALVRLRSGGKLYSGNGISTDIIGAAIRAYLGAINKIVYEET